MGIRCELGDRMGHEGDPSDGCAHGEYLSMRARYGLAGAVLVVGAVLTGCGGGGATSVEVKGFRFQPSSVSIGSGESVIWTQTDNTNHTITSGVPGSPDGEIDHRDFGQDEKFSHVFAKAGTYKYFCRIHNSMTGTVVVR